LRALKKSFFETPSLMPGGTTSAPTPISPLLPPITLPEKLGASLLMLATLIIGLYPKLLLDQIIPAVESMRFLK
jgi:NADH-quinone oxidoreductase subunit M